MASGTRWTTASVCTILVGFVTARAKTLTTTACATMWTTVWARTMNAACATAQGQIPVIDEILYATDSVFLDPLDEWYVFEYATDTLFTFVCPVSGCTDEAAGNYNPEAVIEDDSCVYGPSECGGVSTVTYDGYTYDLVAIGDQCWFAENLRNEHYANGDAIPGELSDSEWENADDTNLGAQAIYNNDVSTLLITAACTTGTRWMTHVACVQAVGTCRRMGSL